MGLFGFVPRLLPVLLVGLIVYLTWHQFQKVKDSESAIKEHKVFRFFWWAIKPFHGLSTMAKLLRFFVQLAFWVVLLLIALNAVSSH